MKRLFYLFGILFAVTIMFNSCTSCQKEKEVEEVQVVEAPVPVVVKTPVVREITLEDFIVQSCLGLKGEYIDITIPGNVKTDAECLYVGKFKTEWEVEKLKPILKKYPLTVIDRHETSQNLLYYATDIESFDPEDILYVEEAPAYLAIVDGEFYLVKKDGTFWPTH